MLIGVVASAPMGPVGVLCLQRTLNKGRWYGFFTGCGAALSDLLYALITGFGMSFVFNYVDKGMFWLQLLGCAMLLGFGVYTFRIDPARSIRPVTKATKGSFFYNFLTAFLVTLSNPLIIFLFIGLFARFSFVGGGAFVSETTIGYMSIVFGALLWWFLLSYGVSKVRGQIDKKGIQLLNRIIGIIVIGVSAIGICFTLLGEPLY